MPPVIVETAGDPNANSYVSVAEADLYFDGRLGAIAWSGATADEKKQALVMGASRLQQLRYVGTATYEDQALLWPRQNVLDDDGFLVDDETVPEMVRHAQLELALYLLANKDVDVYAPTGLESFKRVKTPAVEIELRDLPESVEDRVVTDLPRNVYGLLRRWLLPIDAVEEFTFGTFSIIRR
jgi:hypothetical protein